MQNALVTVRDYNSGDRSFILATWLRGCYYGNTFYSDIPKDIFMLHYHEILEKFLNNPSVTIKIACLKDDEEVILGYSISRSAKDKKVMDWIFVKSAWRRIGIGKSLVPENLEVCTHLTKLGKALKPQSVVFNPFI